MEKVKGPLVGKDGNKYKFTKSTIASRLVMAISHGIGHNIGFMHDDKGIMDNLNNTTIIDKNMPDGFGGNTGTNYRAETAENHVTPGNAGALKGRVDEMTTKGRDYWKGKTDNEGKDASGSGVIKMQEAPKKQ